MQFDFFLTFLLIIFHSDFKVMALIRRPFGLYYSDNDNNVAHVKSNVLILFQAQHSHYHGTSRSIGRSSILRFQWRSLSPFTITLFWQGM